MWYLLFKAAISGAIVVLVSETAKRNPSLGALFVSVPLVSVLAMLWLWQETKDHERLASLAGSTFWMILPSLPMFLLLPVLIRQGLDFYVALGISCALTVVLYFLMIWLLSRFGITL